MEPPFPAVVVASALMVTAHIGIRSANADEGYAGVGWSDSPAAAEPDASSATAVPYEFRLEGVEDDDLAELLRRGSALLSLVDKPPLSQAALLTRIEHDRDTSTPFSALKGGTPEPSKVASMTSPRRRPW